MKYKLSALALNILNFALPLHCNFCENIDELSLKIGICKKCIPSKSPEKKLRCNACKSELVGELCEYCSSRNIFFERLEYLSIKEDWETSLINKIKFHDEPLLSNYFRMGFKKKWKIFQFPKFSFLTYIPSNTKTIKNRPLSPIHSIESILEEKTGLKLQDMLKKVSKENQSGRTYRERFIHAFSSMEIKPEFKNKLKGNILLIDDVFTTGATMNETSRILLENGAEKIYLLALLRGE
jgi:predicted amidophosphoribosyltransferase